ncbi:MAG: NUDIX domain-containing protein [Planctomycetota bacterium]|jgi:predicted NUDIX family phosphoesterase
MGWPDERVLVVPRSELFAGEATAQGFATRDLDVLLERIRRFAEFQLRDRVEEDPSLKQVIPYVVITREDRIFLLRRFATQSESRLHNLYSIGVGGHINPVDAEEGDRVEEGLKRELAEEVRIEGPFDLRPIGYLNDDSNPVGSVHFGLVYVARVRGGEVQVVERDMMEGRFVPPEEAYRVQDGMETWSKILLSAIRDRPAMAFSEESP